ncbi:MAG: enoyl-CoA hydratase-related protein [Fidelibacterota bacterium]
MMTEKVGFNSFHGGQVICLTLQAAPGNILDRAMMEQLQQRLYSLKDNSCVKLIQFTGNGDHFSFGANVREHTRTQVGAMLKQFHQLFYTLMDLSIPTAALISGQCLGGGLELALACDFLFADSTARLGQPEINLGVFPPPASLLLPIKIGQPRASDLLLTGRTITAEEGQAVGLVTELFDDRDAMEAGVDQWFIKYFRPKSTSSLRHALQAARWQLNQTLREELPRIEQYYLEKLMTSHDANEGIEAFLEHRDPKWEDC